jgi:hypothetical protein
LNHISSSSWKSSPSQDIEEIRSGLVKARSSRSHCHRHQYCQARQFESAKIEIFSAVIHLLVSSPFIYQAIVKIRRSGQRPSIKALQQLVVRCIKEKKYQKKRRILTAHRSDH